MLCSVSKILTLCNRAELDLQLSFFRKWYWKFHQMNTARFSVVLNKSCYSLHIINNACRAYLALFLKNSTSRSWNQSQFRFSLAQSVRFDLPSFDGQGDPWLQVWCTLLGRLNSWPCPSVGPPRPSKWSPLQQQQQQMHVLGNVYLAAEQLLTFVIVSMKVWMIAFSIQQLIIFIGQLGRVKSVSSWKCLWACYVRNGWHCLRKSLVITVLRRKEKKGTSQFNFFIGVCFWREKSRNETGS